MNFLKTHKKKLVSILIIGLAGYWYIQTDRTEISPVTAVVVEQVERGDVTSGIETTGEIVAAQKLDLDVYKQAARIDLVNVVNGGSVAAGDVLFAFDSSDVLVEVQSSRVGVAEAELTLENERSNVSDPNTTVRTLENDIVELEASVVQAKVDKKRAYRVYLNANLEPVPANNSTQDQIRPIISGLYSGETEGQYVIDVYRSGTESGYSFRVSGLETRTVAALIGLPSDLGRLGLDITFANTLQVNDSWIVAVPNVYAPEYVSNREVYEEAMVDLHLLITNASVSIANKQQEIENILQTDSSQFRDLDVARAQAALAQAQEQLSQNFDVVQEQRIDAPFSGTVEGMENVVIGASPTRDTNDPISLGTLISDDFLATFSLSAVDVAKVEIGQLVLVNVTSFPDTPTLQATITEISSLPNSDGVAQYEVQAAITVLDDLSITLREGLLVDIEIVEEVVKNVLRIPSAAVSYENRQAQVRVLTDVTPEQQETIDTLNIVKKDAGQDVGFLVDVEVGVTGAFYSEVVSGLSEGQYLVVGDSDNSESVLTGGPSRGRPNND
jgi:multidrug efflux pump subunit AcrA (membrane-fusion protein)